ncbi:MAG: DUF268 domain-containing protein [Bdellovibrionota bacterium]
MAISEISMSQPRPVGKGKRVLKLLYQWWRTAVSDPRRVFRFPGELSGYFSDLKKFRALLAGAPTVVELEPVLFQKSASSGFDAHYVYQSAWAIRRIAAQAPAQHVDISSNIPYVAALSAVVPVRFCEFRPPHITLPGLTTEHVNITELPFASGSVKSLSCLHVLEHIGLGRYGDPVDPEGMAKACRELGRVAAPGASLFLSLPVGRERVCFNMHRVSDPGTLPKIFSGFQLKEFSVVTDDRRYLEGVAPADFSGQQYACGLYWFVKEPLV